MSTWRRLAIEQFPELGDDITSEASLVDLAYELRGLLVASLDSEDSEIGQRVLAFAVWAAGNTKNESFVHFLHDVFGDIIQSDRRRSALWRHLKPAQFAVLSPYFVSEMRGSRISPREIETEYRFARKV